MTIIITMPTAPPPPPNTGAKHGIHCASANSLEIARAREREREREWDQPAIQQAIGR